MKTTKNMKYMSALAVVLLAGLVSCEDKVELNPIDSASVENEAVVDSYFEDTDDIALTAVSSDSSPLTGEDAGAGRMISNGILDHRFKCAAVTIELSGDNSKQVPHGTITIDFGTGCTDNQGNTRKGKVIVEYNGRRFSPNSTIVTTTDGYSINDIALEGTRTVTNVSGSTDDAPKFNVVLDNGKATWPDASVATREVNRTHEWIRAANPLNDEWHVTGTASGTNREGKVYEMEITSALVYKRECAISAKVFIAVAGTKELTVNGRKLTIDYGTGDCDRTVTISVDGSSKQLDV
jgi:hypothetical protein